MMKRLTKYVSKHPISDKNDIYKDEKGKRKPN